MDKKVAIVTGGSSGIGKSTAALLRASGYTVYTLSRHETGEESHLAADVADASQVQAAFARVFAQTGRLDLLVNSAGMGISGPIELTSEADARAIFDVNFFGTLHCVQSALPYLRQTKNGRIVNLSSVAAPLSIPYQAFYSATKAAINALTKALSNETAHFGIRVCAVMPGDVRTGFTESRRKTPDNGLYPAADHAVAVMEQDELGGMTPHTVARVILKAATAKSPKILYVAGGKYKLFCLIEKLLPATLCNKLVGKIYA
ncbi:MAG: SDR family NAD(P)-dependent oxidoreductase [Clostridia bacterium]|nr:SDR family NAD(P)-dependent oxidoreductase [Clostridia bacterium]